MRYIIDVPDGIHKRVVQLIASADYATMQDFALTALQNQLLIEDASAGGDDGSSNLQIGDFSALKADGVDFSAAAISAGAVSTTGSPQKSIPAKWLFGQVNRVLPIKFGLRILIALLKDAGDSLVLDWFHEKAAYEARRFGQILKQQDEARNRKRGERLSVGFPTGQLAKSTSRYKSHFLGYQQLTTGRSVGALPELGFAVIAKEDGGGYSIGVTKGGLKFGLLPNPALDDGEIGETMSNEEAIYYVEHVCAEAKGEADALGLVMGWIAEGHGSPEEMDARMALVFPDWSSSMRGTNRSGAIGRAADLGLVLKVRTGADVRYELSDLGSDMLSVIETRIAIGGGT